MKAQQISCQDCQASQGAHANVHQVLHQDVRSVLGTAGACLQHTEAGMPGPRIGNADAGKSWENHGKIMENHGKTWKTMGKSWKIMIMEFSVEPKLCHNLIVIISYCMWVCPERRYTPPVCHSNKEYKHWICGTISGQIDRKGMVIAPSRPGSMHCGSSII